MRAFAIDNERKNQMSKVKMDIVDDYANKVDAAIKAARESTKIAELLDSLKEFFRETGGKIIGIDEKSIKFSGKLGTITVSFPSKMKIKFKPGKTIDSIPANVKNTFFKKVVKYEPVENFEDLIESDESILDYVSLVDDTPRVTIPQ
jgi:hypothetical protein